MNTIIIFYVDKACLRIVNYVAIIALLVKYTFCSSYCICYVHVFILTTHRLFMKIFYVIYDNYNFNNAHVWLRTTGVRLCLPGMKGVIQRHMRLRTRSSLLVCTGSLTSHPDFLFICRSSFIA